MDDDPKPCFAMACSRLAENMLSMTIVEGRYHQVKRMIAAVGNHVDQLHRSQIGAYHLPLDLAQGQWRWLNPDDLKQLAQSMNQ